MTQILIYDIEFEKISDLAEEFDTEEKDIVAAMMDAIESEGIDISVYL